MPRDHVSSSLHDYTQGKGEDESMTSRGFFGTGTSLRGVGKSESSHQCGDPHKSGSCSQVTR